MRHMCVVSAHLHNFKTKIPVSCYAMPAHLITKRVGGVRVSFSCSQLKLVSGGGRMEVAAAAGRASDEGRRLANLFHQVALDCKVRLSLDKAILFLENINLTRRGCHRW